MDKIYFLNIIILMAIAIAIALLPFPKKYLEEDKIHKNDPSFKIFHLNDLWKRSIPFVIFGFSLYSFCIVKINLLIWIIICFLILYIVFLWYRGTYLISDGMVIKYVKRGKVQCQFNYEDIDKVRKHEVSTGRFTTRMYYVLLKDGQIHKIKHIFPEILKENFHEWRARSKRNYWIEMALIIPMVWAVLAIFETAWWYVGLAIFWIIVMCPSLYYRWEGRRIDKALNAFNQHRDSGLKIVH